MLRFPDCKALLFVPANRRERLEKAALTKADAVILDLEDSVAPDAKADARQTIPEAIGTLRSMGRAAIVRVNSGAELDADLECMKGGWPDAVLIPKVETAGDVVLGLDKLARLGAPDDTGLAVLIETPSGVMNLSSIAAALPRKAALAFGGEDYAVAMGVAPGREELSFAAHQVALAARAFGLTAFGLIGSIADIKDEGAFAGHCVAARKAGFTGTLAIHPSQIDIAIAAFSPTAAEIDWARAVVQDSEGSNGAAVKGRDGRMIDRPILERARQTLERQPR